MACTRPLYEKQVCPLSCDVVFCLNYMASRVCFIVGYLPWKPVLWFLNQIKSDLLVKYKGTVRPPQTMLKKNWRSMGVKEGKGTRKSMLSPRVARKCQAWENWLIPSGWEVSQRRLLSSGVCENCGCATWSRPRRPRSDGSSKKNRSWQVKPTVENVVGQGEVSAKPATFERKDI